MTANSDNSPQLPKGWAWTILGDATEIILGQSPPSSTYNEHGIGLPFYQGKLEFGSLYPTPHKWCTLPKKIAEKGDVLISVRAPVGPTNICPDKSCIGRGLAAIRSLGGMDRLYILHLMRAFEHELSGKGTGTTFGAITGDMLKDFTLPLPPLPEQHRIVAKIEELFTRLDTGVEALKKIRVQLKRYRQAVLKYAFEGKLTAEWREAHQNELEPASVLLARIKEERKKTAKDKFKELPQVDTSDLPELPVGWVWATMGEITTVASGGTPSTKEETNFGGNVPWVTPADLSNFQAKFISRGQRNITEKGLNKSSATLLPKGTIIFSSRAPIGYVAIAANELSTNQGCKNFIVFNGIFDEYLFYYLKGSKSLAESYASGTTFLELTASKAKTLPIPLPPLPEQRKIVEEIERHFSIADQIEKVIEQSLKQADRLRRSILKKAFEGKLVPQDPSDEPAEKLLARIRIEKAKREAEKRAPRGKSVWTRDKGV